MNQKNLLVLGCSSTKTETAGYLPAISLYDGPVFRVLRSFLQDYRWPSPLSVAVLSAKYGLIGGVSHISHYEQRMTMERATELEPAVTENLRRLVLNHGRIELLMGKDYLRCIDSGLFESRRGRLHFVPGSIGVKLHRLRRLLYALPAEKRSGPRELTSGRRPLYFLPDWDDFVDKEFDFDADVFSSKDRAKRKEAHISSLTYPQRMCDGVLVSLAQNLGSKGLLKRVVGTDQESLAPRPVREHFKLGPDQWAFGDCGAFSYASEDTPTITVEQAVSVYELYEFDLGASVDHIPLDKVQGKDKVVKLTNSERRARVRLTRDNAERFMNLHRQYGARFVPVGIIQGLSAEDYARQVGDYSDMGYTHLALGGLVPRTDEGIASIVEAVISKLKALRVRPWLHLMGIFRPELQSKFKQLGVNSFDSASYFRKAWLRSSQNYLGADGAWYAAIRVPLTTDPRTRSRLKESGVGLRGLQSREKKALKALHGYDRGRVSLCDCLTSIRAYDKLLARAEAEEQNLIESYRQTLEAKPWRSCGCNVCRAIGIDVVVFRGLNRNKRRGAHNTLQLYRTLTTSP